jgi:hypothetical protein
VSFCCASISARRHAAGAMEHDARRRPVAVGGVCATTLCRVPEVPALSASFYAGSMPLLLLASVAAGEAMKSSSMRTASAWVDVTDRPAENVVTV